MLLLETILIPFPLLLYLKDFLFYLKTSKLQKYKSLLFLNACGLAVLGYILSLFHFPKDEWQSYALKHSKILLKESYIGLSFLLKLLCKLIFFGFFALLIKKITRGFLRTLAILTRVFIDGNDAPVSYREMLFCLALIFWAS